MRSPSTRERGFIENLVRRAGREDSQGRAAMAALRRGVGKPPGTVAEVHQYVAPWLPPVDDPFSPWEQSNQDAYYLVATLFALHQRDHWREGQDSRRRNLGWSFRRLTTADDSGSIEKRFTALLNSHRDDLPAHLRGAVSLLDAHEIPINWAQLLPDIQRWDWEDRNVQRAWAQAFWGGGGGDGPAEDVAEAEDDTSVASAIEE